MLQSIIQQADSEPDILALWLYGSRARGDHSLSSDYDLAVLFADQIDDAFERRVRPEVRALEWQEKLVIPEGKLSIVDISSCSIPLAWSVLDEGQLLLDKSPNQREQTESRIFSLWRSDYLPRLKRLA